MTQLTAPRFHHAPMRALGLSIVFAGAVIAAAVLVQQVAPSEGQTSIAAAAPAVPAVAGEIPAQVAPLEGQTSVSHRSGLPAGEIPHQAAPLESQTSVIAAAPVISAVRRGPAPGRHAAGLNEMAVPAAGESPHQVAPLEGLND